MAKQLLGKEVTAAMNEKLQQRVAALKEKGVTPKLAIVRCGENPSDLSYEKGATKRAELIGINVQKFVLPEDASKEDLLKLIDEINANQLGAGGGTLLIGQVRGVFTAADDGQLRRYALFLQRRYPLLQAFVHGGGHFFTQ